MRGCSVAAVDASSGMVARIAERASAQGVAIDARAMDGEALAFADGSFDAAISVFGVILFPDAARGMSEMRRVVRAGGRIGVVTWTEPQDYELATALRAAVQAVRPDAPPASLPAQLRYREREAFAALFAEAGFSSVEIVTRRETLVVPSARWLARRLRFAPGMAAQLDGLGDLAAAVLERFVADVEGRWGTGPAEFAGKAFVGTASVS